MANSCRRACACQWPAIDQRHSSRGQLAAAGDTLTETPVQVPVRGTLAVTVELHFRPLEPPGLLHAVVGPRGRMVAFLAAACFLLFWLYLVKSWSISIRRGRCRCTSARPSTRSPKACW